MSVTPAKKKIRRLSLLLLLLTNILSAPGHAIVARCWKGVKLHTGQVVAACNFPFNGRIKGLLKM